MKLTNDFSNFKYHFLKGLILLRWWLCSTERKRKLCPYNHFKPQVKPRVRKLLQKTNWDQKNIAEFIAGAERSSTRRSGGGGGGGEVFRNTDEQQAEISEIRHFQFNCDSSKAVNPVVRSAADKFKLNWSKSSIPIWRGISARERSFDAELTRAINKQQQQRSSLQPLLHETFCFCVAAFTYISRFAPRVCYLRGCECSLGLSARKVNRNRTETRGFSSVSICEERKHVKLKLICGVIESELGRNKISVGQRLIPESEESHQEPLRKGEIQMSNTALFYTNTSVAVELIVK